MPSPMSAGDFAAALDRLGWSAEHAAAELDVTPHVVAAWRAGTTRVSNDVAQQLRFLVAIEERQRLMRESGLPACETMEALDASAAGTAPDAVAAHVEKLEAHFAACPTCQARAEYLDRQGFAMPDPPMPGLVRVAERVARVLQRLPAPLRPPEGDAGDGRRAGVFVALAFSTFALVLMTVAAVGAAVQGRWRGALAPYGFWAAVTVGYLVGFYVAGWVVDATRRIRHRLAGHVVRGAVCVPIVYGAIGGVMTLAGEFEASLLLGFMGLMSALGAAGGAVLWAVRRVRGTLPLRAA